METNIDLYYFVKKYLQMNVPNQLKYTKDHEWVKIDGEIATIGITDFAQKELGDIVYVEIESTGENLLIEEVFGTVEAVKTVSDLFMPLSGQVLEFNTALEDAPEFVNQDPYESGWMIRIRPLSHLKGTSLKQTSNRDSNLFRALSRVSLGSAREGQWFGTEKFCPVQPWRVIPGGVSAGLSGCTLNLRISSESMTSSRQFGG